MSRQENDTIYRQETTKHLKHRLYETAANNPDIAGVFSEIADNRVETWIEELPSAQQRWIPFTKRDLTVEEREEHPEWCYIMECPLPDDGQEILVSNGWLVWLDTFYVDDGCYLDSDHEFEGCAWMPLPDPWKGGEE